MSANKVSVVIPTYNRSELLKETLRSLVAQKCDDDLFEVIVVDDGSKDNTRHVVNSFKDRINLHYFFQEDKGFRAAKARNIGIFSAKHEICLFLDSGVIAPDNLILAHSNHYKGSDDDVLIGFSYGFDEFEVRNEKALLSLYREHHAEGIFRVLAQNNQYPDCRYDHLHALENGYKSSCFPWFVFWTCHVSCKTSLLKDVEGFDESFCRWGGEDMELGIRLFSAGGKFGLLSTPLALHLPHDKSAEYAKASGQESLKYIIDKHSDISSDILKMNWSQAILLSK
ncbi:glycosyltransferase [Enterovibrio calviensis]|uniref:glycosyltransferase n=1 Tax=Enterovibrio calviensis TaxID=91359 RepID=UPI00373536A9